MKQVRKLKTVSESVSGVPVSIFVFFVSDLRVAFFERGLREHVLGKMRIKSAGVVERLVVTFTVTLAGDLQRDHHTSLALVVRIDGGFLRTFLSVFVHGGHHTVQQ